MFSSGPWIHPLYCLFVYPLVVLFLSCFSSSWPWVWTSPTFSSLFIALFLNYLLCCWPLNESRVVKSLDSRVLMACVWISHHFLVVWTWNFWASIPHLWNGDKTDYFLTGLMWGFTELTHVKCLVRKDPINDNNYLPCLCSFSQQFSFMSPARLFH